MSAQELQNIASGADIYLKPTSFIDSPQQHDGACARLAGGMLWFSAIELSVHLLDQVKRFIIPVHDWESYVQALPEEYTARAKLLYARITSARTPLQMGERIIRLDQPQIMGILNVTPDSFSDGGKHDVNTQAAAEAAFAMTSAGASIIDIGGESTRPGAPLVWEGDEIKRVEHVIQKVASSGTAVSIDTRKAAVMANAVAGGARMINDISALLYDQRATEVAQQSAVPVVLMHAPSQSSDPHKGGDYNDVVSQVFDWLETRVDAVDAAGISRDKILIDPGLGFGKSLADNMALINNIAMFHAIGCPIVFGASRKRLIGALSNEAPVDDRLGGSVYLAMKAVEQGVQILRVHDVPETVQAVRVWRGLRDSALTMKA
jgi:dihydropteroate synthase